MKLFRVAEILTGTKLILNCGRDLSIKNGNRFLIYGLSKVLKDPETGEDLGQAEIIRGEGQVIHLQDKLCTIESCMYDSGSSRVIKKSQPISIFSGGTTTEEEVLGERRLKPFEDAQIGDYARLIK
jgi:hypothetical protein